MKRTAFFAAILFTTVEAGAPAGGLAAPGPAARVSMALPLIEGVDSGIPSRGFRLDLPPEFGKIESIHSGPGPALVHIQTAHGNYEMQKKIQSILKHLKDEYGFDLVLMEGSVHQLVPEQLNFFPSYPEETGKTLERLMKRAYVKGAEMFLKEAKGGALGLGIEDLDVYAANGRAFAEVLTQQEKTEGFLREMDLQIERLTAPFMGPGLKGFVKEYERFRDHVYPFQDWLNYLKEKSRELLKIDLTDAAYQVDWPMLLRVFTLQKFEAELDLDAYRGEKDAFLEELRKREPERGDPDPGFDRIAELLNNPSSPHQLPDPETYFLFERLAASLPEDFAYEKYPNVRIVIGRMILNSELKSGRLMEELDRLTEKVFRELAKTEEEKQVLALLKHYWLLEALFKLELTPEEWEKIDRSLRPAAVAGRFLELNRAGRVRNIEFDNLEEIEKLFDSAVSFYELVTERDKVMIANVRRRMEETGKDKAVVITGGFHAQPFERHFSSGGFNYALVMPRMTTLDGREAYVASVLETRRATYETVMFFSEPPESLEAYGIAREKVDMAALGAAQAEFALGGKSLAELNRALEDSARLRGYRIQPIRNPEDGTSWFGITRNGENIAMAPVTIETIVTTVEAAALDLAKVRFNPALEARGRALESRSEMRSAEDDSSGILSTSSLEGAAGIPGPMETADSSLAFDPLDSMDAEGLRDDESLDGLELPVLRGFSSTRDPVLPQGLTELSQTEFSPAGDPAFEAKRAEFESLKKQYAAIYQSDQHPLFAEAVKTLEKLFDGENFENLSPLLEAIKDQGAALYEDAFEEKTEEEFGAYMALNAFMQDSATTVGAAQARLQAAAGRQERLAELDYLSNLLREEVFNELDLKAAADLIERAKTKADSARAFLNTKKTYFSTDQIAELETAVRAVRAAARQRKESAAVEDFGEYQRGIDRAEQMGLKFSVNMDYEDIIESRKEVTAGLAQFTQAFMELEAGIGISRIPVNEIRRKEAALRFLEEKLALTETSILPRYEDMVQKREEYAGVLRRLEKELREGTLADLLSSIAALEKILIELQEGARDLKDYFKADRLASGRLRTDLALLIRQIGGAKGLPGLINRLRDERLSREAVNLRKSGKYYEAFIAAASALLGPALTPDGTAAADPALAVNNLEAGIEALNDLIYLSAKDEGIYFSNGYYSLQVSELSARTSGWHEAIKRAKKEIADTFAAQNIKITEPLTPVLDPQTGVKLPPEELIVLRAFQQMLAFNLNKIQKAGEGRSELRKPVEIGDSVDQGLSREKLDASLRSELRDGAGAPVPDLVATSDRAPVVSRVFMAGLMPFNYLAALSPAAAAAYISVNILDGREVMAEGVVSQRDTAREKLDIAGLNISAERREALSLLAELVSLDAARERFVPIEFTEVPSPEMLEGMLAAAILDEKLKYTVYLDTDLVSDLGPLREAVRAFSVKRFGYAPDNLQIKHTPENLLLEINKGSARAEATGPVMPDMRMLERMSVRKGVMRIYLRGTALEASELAELVAQKLLDGDLGFSDFSEIFDGKSLLESAWESVVTQLKARVAIAKSA